MHESKNMKAKTPLAAFLALAVTCSGSFGQVTWNRSQNVTWTTGSNWSSGSDLSQLNFTGYSSRALILITGEIVAAEPATWMMLEGGVASHLVFRNLRGHLTQ
jgi:hypothetical protein